MSFFFKADLSYLEDNTGALCSGQPINLADNNNSPFI